MIDIGVDIEDHVSGFFSTDMWCDTYERANIPLRGAQFCMNSTYHLVTAPPPPKLPGREKGSKYEKFPRMKGKYESPKNKPMKETLEEKDALSITPNAVKLDTMQLDVRNIHRISKFRRYGD